MKFLFVSRGVSQALSKETLHSNFAENLDENTEKHCLVNENIILELAIHPRTYFCLNILEKLPEITQEINGGERKLSLNVDQPLDKEFEPLDYVFQTEANRAVPNRGKYYHCTLKTDKSFSSFVSSSLNNLV